jgi:hypothetical protein
MKKSEVRSPKSEVKLKAERRKQKTDSKPVQMDFGETKNTSAPPVGGADSQLNKSDIEHPKSETKQQLTTHNSLLTNMEVHHHPEVEKKGFKEYILEGLMIFLAVTMGFFAESLREHISDGTKETGYVISLKQDLQHDTANLVRQTYLINLKIIRIDSLILLFNKSSLNVNETNDAYFYARIATRKPNFEVTNRTVVQLKNAGTFRLIKNEDLISSILEYQKQDDSYTETTATDATERGFLYPFISKIFDANVFQTMVDSTNIIHRTTGIHHIKKADKEFINQFIYYIHQLKSSFIVEKEILVGMKKKADDMIQIIHTGYNE